MIRRRSNPWALGWAGGAAVGAVLFLLVRYYGPPVPSGGRELNIGEFRDSVELGLPPDPRYARLTNLHIYPARGEQQVGIGTLVRDDRPDERVRFTTPLPFTIGPPRSRAQDAEFRRLIEAQHDAQLRPEGDDEFDPVQNRVPFGPPAPPPEPVSSFPRTFDDLPKYLASLPSKQPFVYEARREPLTLGGIAFAASLLAFGLLLPPVLLLRDALRRRRLAADAAAVSGPTPARSAMASDENDHGADARRPSGGGR